MNQSNSSAKRSTFRQHAALAALATMIAVPTLRAASGNYTATVGGSWGTAASWSSNPTVPGSAAGDIININSNITAAATITLDGTRTMGSLLVGDSDSSAAYTLSAGTSGILTLDQTGVATALVHFGVAGSTAAITNIISAPITLADNARFYTTLTASQNLTGVISGAFSMTYDNDDGVTTAGPTINQGQFLVNAAAANTYTGGTTIDDVRVTIQGNNAALGAAGTAVNILDGGQVFNSTGLTAIANAFTIAGNGWLETTGQLGALRLDSGAIVTGTVTMSANAAIGSNSGTGTVNGIVSGAGFTLTKVGAGTLVLGGVNTYSGGTTVSAGVLQLNNASAAGSGTITIAPAATTANRVLINGGVAIANPISFGNTVSVAGVGVIQQTGTGLGTVNGPITITGVPSAGGHFVGGTVATNALVLNGTISSTVGLTQRDGFVRYGGGGTGYTSLTVTNTAQVGATDGISTAATVILGGSGNATIDLNGFNQTLAGVTMGNATNPFAGTVALGTKTLTLNGDLTTVTSTGSSAHTVTAAAGGTLNFGATPHNLVVNDNPFADDLTINGATISAAGGVTKTGTGTLALTGATVTDGPLIISSGTLEAGRISAAGSFTASALTFGPGPTTLRMKIGTAGSGDSITVSGAGGLTTSGGTTTVSLNQLGGMLPNGTYNLINYTGASPGLGGFTLAPIGHATATLVDTGTTIAVTITNNDRVIWDGTASTAWNTSLTQNWKLSFDNTPANYNDGDDIIFQDTPVTSNVDIAANVIPSKVTFTNTSATPYAITGAGGIIGTTSLTKSGNGTVVLREQNSYSGPTTVSAGTLELDHDATGNLVLTGTSGVSVAAGATLKLTRDDGNITFNRDISGAGTAIIDPHSAAGAAVRDVAITGNDTGFSGLWKFSPTVVGATGTGSFRTNTQMTPTSLGSAAVEVDNGGQLWVLTNFTYANNLTITGTGYAETAGGTPLAGTGFTYGGIGAIRAENGVNFSGSVTLNGNARIGANNGATVTYSGSISITNPSDLFVVSGGSQGCTTVLTGSNAFNNVWINAGSATAVNHILQIGNNGTAGTLGTGSVTLNGDTATAILRFDRADGYTLASGNTITSSGTTIGNTQLQIDTQGAGFNSNGVTINLGTSAAGGTFRVGTTRTGAIANINSSLSALGIRVGDAQAGATLNLNSGASVSVSTISLAPAGANAAASTLNIGAGATLNIATTLFMGDVASATGNVNQSGGDVIVGGHIRVGHFPTNTSTYTISNGTLNLSAAATATFPYTTGATEQNGGIYLGVDGTGNLTQNGGTVTTNFVVLDNRTDTNVALNTPSGYDTYALNGGTLVLKNAFGIISRNVSAAFNFNGGTVQAAPGINPALDTNKINVLAGGGTLDTNGANTFTLYGPLSGTGTVTLANTGAGSGTLSLVDGGAGANTTVGGTMPGGSLGTASINIGGNTTLQVNRATNQVWSGAIGGTGTFNKLGGTILGLTGSGSGFTGTLNVVAGRIDVPTNLAAATINVSDFATLGGEPTAPSALTLGSVSGANVLFNPSTPGALTAATVTVNGANTLDFSAAPSGPGPWTALNYTTKVGAGTFALANAASYRNAPIITDTGSSITVDVPGTQALTWTGAAGATWNVNSTPSWNNPTPAADVFFAGDTVAFDDSSAVGAVAVASGVSPWKTTVNSNTTAYTLTSSGSGIAGPGNLEKSGSSTLTLVGPNTYNGQTVISGGILSIASATSLGNGSTSNTIAISGGAKLIPSASLDLGPARGIAVATGGGILSSTGAAALTITVSGNLSGSDPLTLTSGASVAPTYVLSGNNSGFTGDVFLDSVGATATGTTLALASNNALTAGTLTVSFPPTSTSGVATTVRLDGVTITGVTLALSSNTSGAISQRSQLTTSTGVNVWNSPLVLSGTDVIQMTTAHSLTLNGNISASNAGFTGTFFLRGAAPGIGVINNSINLPNASVNKTDSGMWTINSSVGNSWANTIVAVGTLKMGAAGVFPSTVNLTLGQNDANAAVLDLNGFSQTVGTLASNPTTAGANTTPKSITSATAATLTVNQFSNTTYASVLTGSMSLLKSGNGVLTLAGANTFTGGLTVNGGTVIGTNAAAPGTGTSRVQTGGTLQAGASFTNPISLEGGTLSSQGSPGSVTNKDLTAAAGTTSTVLAADATNPATNSEVIVSGTLRGSGNINFIAGTNNPSADSGVGFRLRGTAVSDFSGTITVGNSAKLEFQTAQAGPFSPGGTGKVVLTGGSYTVGTLNGSYSDINIRNNSAGDTILGNDFSISGSGIGMINMPGSSPVGSTALLGNLTIGDTQTLGVYRNAGNMQVIKFSTVTLTGGTATFAPTPVGFAAGGIVNLALGPISENTTGSSILANGNSTLTLTAANNYSGSTTVASGTVLLGAAGALPATTDLTVNGGTLDLNNVSNSNDQTVNSLAGAGGTITNSDAANLRTLTVNQSSSTLYSGALTGNLTLTKTGTGTLTLSGAQSYIALNANGGTTTLASALPNAIITNNAGTLNINANAFGSMVTVKGATNFGSSQTLSSLTIGAGGVATLTAHTGGPVGINAIDTSGLTITGNGKLDLANNAMIVRGGSESAITAKVASGFDGGLWDGPGINSSTAAADPNFRTAVAVVNNVDLGYTDFDGVTGLTGSEILLKYTYFGDSDLTGTVTSDDFGLFLDGFNGVTPAKWVNGDYDYSGTVTSDDFGLFLESFNNQGGALRDPGLAAQLDAFAQQLGAGGSGGSIDSGSAGTVASSQAVVPEPGSAGLLAVGALGLLGRRRRLSPGS